MKTKVIGIATGSRTLEVWHFESNNSFCKLFCEHLVRETGHNVIVIEGEVTGTYKVPQQNVEFIPFEDRFKELAKTSPASLPSTYSGDYINDQTQTK